MAIDKAKVKPNWEKVVEAITRLRSRRLDLITGQAAQARLSAEALDRMLREIDALDAELLSNFTGQVSTSEGSLRARIFVPRECLAQDLVIVTMKDAIVTLGDLSQKCNKPGNKQEQIYAQLTFSALPAEFRSGVPSDADSTMLTLQLAADPREEKQLATVVSQHVTTGERSYYYRIPVSARANVSALNYVCPREHRRIKEKKPTCDKSLTSIKSELAIERVAIAHLGHVASLPPHLGSLNSKFVPTFDEATGALTAITISTTGVSTESLTSLGTAAESVVTATGARQKASRERTNEIARLKAEADALEQQKRIKELQKELDQLNQ
jgi:hypothetical protein